MEFHGDVLGVDHDIFGVTGVDVAPVYGHDGGGGVEILIFQLAQGAAVYGIGIVCAECLDIETVCASADLLVRGEADADACVRRALP